MYQTLLKVVRASDDPKQTWIGSRPMARTPRRASAQRAVAKVFAAKDRPRFNPLIVLVGSREEAETYAVVTDRSPF